MVAITMWFYSSCPAIIRTESSNFHESWFSAVFLPSLDAHTPLLSPSSCPLFNVGSVLISFSQPLLKLSVLDFISLYFDFPSVLMFSLSQWSKSQVWKVACMLTHIISGFLLLPVHLPDMECHKASSGAQPGLHTVFPPPAAFSTLVDWGRGLQEIGSWRTRGVLCEIWIYIT